jgi:hypothetical protein
MKDITPLIQSGGDWRYSAIQHTAPDEHKAFICSPRGSYLVGTFKTQEEADEAIAEAEQARWNG